MTEIVTEPQLQAARWFKQQYSLYQQNRDLINVGAYAKGSNTELDKAIAIHPKLIEFLQQNMKQPVLLQQSQQDLIVLLQKFVEGKKGN